MIDQVRRFNRVVTQRVGALNDEFLARGRPLGQARLLWEVGPGGSDLRSLRSRLDLDSGYLSRLLRALEADDLVIVERSGADGRVRTVRLTEHGRAERAELDRRSGQVAGSILEPLGEGQRDRLVSAMAEVERLLAASMVEISGSIPGADARTCLHAYTTELAAGSRRLRPGAGHLGPRCRSGPPRRALPPRAAARRARRLRRAQTTPGGRPRSSACGSLGPLAASASAAGCSQNWNSRRRRGARHVRLDTNPTSLRPSPCTDRRDTARSRVQRRAVRPSLVREGDLLSTGPGSYYFTGRGMRVQQPSVPAHPGLGAWV